LRYGDIKKKAETQRKGYPIKPRKSPEKQKYININEKSEPVKLKRSKKYNPFFIREV